MSSMGNVIPDEVKVLVINGIKYPIQLRWFDSDEVEARYLSEIRIWASSEREAIEKMTNEIKQRKQGQVA